MCYQETLLEIHNLFQHKLLDSEKIKKINHLLSKLSDVELAQIHSDFNFSTLEGVYLLLSNLNFTSEAKEHITYRYYLALSQQVDEQGYLNNQILYDIVNAYKQTSYLALESLVVKLLKEDRISIDGLTIKKSIDSAIILKEAFTSAIKEKIKKSEKLCDNDVKQLLNYDKYKILEDALDNNLVERSGLLMFRSPDNGEKNKKHKSILFLKAKKLLDNL